MTARQQRRQVERKARKAANKTQGNQPVPGAPTATGSDESFDWTPESSAATRAAINRANAQHSTGPRTPAGKAASSQNNFRHGLTGNFAVLAWEDLERFVELCAQFHEEHQPITMTEFLLVERMAQHQWLSQRALHLQNTCFHMDVSFCEQEKQLALYLRYGATHDRAFHKCLSDLLKLRAQRSKEQAGFESQKRQAAAETRKQELHAVKITTLRAKEKPASPATPVPYATAGPDTIGFLSQNAENRAPEPLWKAA